ncbi:hypothetical protein FOC4_g10011932 [Fusarium odoratissimum]|uniref:Uncharacterized protein n=1 Tax=Fusarium oxysporum f. sp. cubense (strain race 4) TaxID=2502994 RepID=N1REU7_FUSC4|nr:hypothetical protein FOC4_g10011932 [Fusarium odoratissimum]
MSDGEAGRLAPTVPGNASVTSALRGLSIAGCFSYRRKSIPRTCGYDEGTLLRLDMAASRWRPVLKRLPCLAPASVTGTSVFTPVTAPALSFSACNWQARYRSRALTALISVFPGESK